MPLQSNPNEGVVPIRIGHGIRIDGHAVVDFTPVATHRVGVVRIDPVATAVDTAFTFAAAESFAGEFDITYDAEYEIDGNAHFVDQASVPTLLVSSTTFTNADEYYLIGVIEISTGRTIDFVIVYRQKDNLDVFDSATQTVDEELLDWVLALAGSNSKYRQLSYGTGQPATAEIQKFNTAMETLSTLPDDFEDTTGLSATEAYSQTVDAFGNQIKTQGGE